MSEPVPARLLLIDASPYIFRAYYSLPRSIQAPDGMPVNALRGFADFLGRLVQDEAPTHLLVACDGDLTGSFRNEIYPAYKSSREEPDADLVAQLEPCYELIEALGLPSAIDDRYEADDLIATARAKFSSDFDRFVVVTADKDLAQLVDDRTEFYDFAKGTRLGHGEVVERFGVRPEQVKDFLGLAGDSVDDIPGVRGVGAKTAMALLSAFDGLDDLYARLDEVAGLGIRGAKTLGAKLAEHRDIAYLSRELATCATDAPLEIGRDGLARRPPSGDTLRALGERYALKNLERLAADLS